MRKSPRLARCAVVICAILLALTIMRLTVGAVPDTVDGNYRGYMTTPQELAEIKQKADQGLEPYKSAVESLIAYAQGPMPTPNSGVVSCSASESPAYVTNGSARVYSYALAYQLTGDANYAQKAKTAIAALYQITDLVDSGDCPLTMGRHIPSWIRAADLLEQYWSPAEKQQFQDWLANVVYPTLYLKYTRGNNWGAVITNAGQYVADYCWDRNDLIVARRNPGPGLSAHEASSSGPNERLHLG